jgi:Zn-dependent protease
MALAGPAANIALVLVSALLIRLGGMSGVFQPPEAIGFDRLASGVESGLWPGLAFFLSVSFSLNLVLAALNLLPLPPLDGSAAIPLALNDNATSRYQDFMRRNAGLSWIGIIIAWQVFPYIFEPVFLLAVNLLYPGLRYG